VLSSLLAGVYFGTLISAITRATHQRGGRTIAVQTENTARTGTDRYSTGPGDPARVCWDQVDGFLVISNSVPRTYVKQLNDAGKPVVLISHEEAGIACPVVVPDSSGLTEAIEHLLGHGHRRIAFVGNLSQHDIRERHEAYCTVLRAHGIEPDRSLCFAVANNREDGGREAARRMIAAGLPSTAVFAATDYNATGVMAELKEAGFRIPRDQAVVGFDDMPVAALAAPALSTVPLPVEGLAVRAVELLAQHLSGHPVAPKRHLVKTSFLARESCGCIGAHAPARTPAEEGPVAEFVHDLMATFDGTGLADVTDVGMPAPTKPSTAPDSDLGPAELGLELAEVLQAATERKLASHELLQISQIAQDLYRFRPSSQAHNLIALAHRLAEALELRRGGEGPGVPGIAEQIDRCLQQVSVGLSRGSAVEQVLLNERFDASLWSQYAISLELLRSHETGPRSLSWMGKTGTRCAVLALWDPHASSPEMELAGTYDVRGEAPAFSQKRSRPEVFPPVEVLRRAAEEPEGSLVFVLPIATTSSDWGFLALVVPPDATMVAAETYFQWAALLSQALDYEAVTASLRQRNEDLAVSYQRERDMADAVRQSEERYAIAARAVNDGIWDWDLRTSTVYYSSRWKDVLGYPEDAIGNSPEEWMSRVHPDDRVPLEGALAERRRGQRGAFEIEHRVRAADDTYRWVLCRGLAVPEDGQPATRLVGSLTDVTERRSLEAQLMHQALYDGLTGLPNRALFLDRLSQAIAHARRGPGYEYAVLWLDLDGFKVVNDSLGHLVGDNLLLRVSERVVTHLREADTAARFGGDEFAVLLHNMTDFSAIDGIVTRLQEDLGRPYDLDGHEVVVTASIGIATSNDSYEKAEDVLRDADIAMYKAKSAGRAGHAMFDSSMYAGAISRLQTESALRQAIEQGQLELHYQPIVELSDGTMSAMEVLVRWRHPFQGLILPGDFLPVAEESGLIVPVGRSVQMQACRQLYDWKGGGWISQALRASINLSNREFWNPGLLDQVDSVLASTGAPPQWVSFEITEGVIMHDLPRALEILGELHDRGIQIHIDDFGTGYSSLEALHRLPIDALKIDRSFVANLEDEKSTELVRAIVNLGSSLNVDVIAEGIETPAQQRMLVDLGCPLGQGYWFSVPLPAEKLGQLLITNGTLPHQNAAGPHQNAAGPHQNAAGQTGNSTAAVASGADANSEAVASTGGR
jgi:diguanylate cyclase (GGDEF)-like protein/PAS domain S-box-containing protein